MEQDAKIDDMKAALAAKRQKQMDWRDKRINLTAAELHNLNREILEDEEFLREIELQIKAHEGKKL